KFSHREKIDYVETAFIINKSEDRPSQSSFIGVLSNELPLFFGEYAKNLWCVFDLDIKELFDFIINPKVSLIPLGEISPNRKLRSRIEEISSQDPIVLLDSKLLKLSASIEKESNKLLDNERKGKKVTEKNEAKLKQLKHEFLKLNNSEEAKAFNDNLLKTIAELKIRFP
ncbi:type I-Fv CRISPR-associated protein Cas5fv, partial [Methylovulum psychrotolerans]|uniref:type I-Fv CRISPR-associated protein Cas5fv n=1 Tax=Methylovulum psychrotolerans TaxID=1704499 RepID=UPI0014759DBB